jgi:hypothetical protein
VNRWQIFFGSGELMPIEEIEGRFPNARRHVRGCVFVSYAGVDGPTLDALITRRLRSKYNHYAVFQYSSRSSGGVFYKDLVLLAIRAVQRSL